MPSIFPAVSPATASEFSLDDALLAVDRAGTSTARLQATVDALHAMGFKRVVATLRDATFSPTMIVKAGSATDGYELDPLPGAVWRRRISAIERFRCGDLYLLDGSDAWVAREFFGVAPSQRSTDATVWLPQDLLLGILHGADNEIIGIVKMALPADGRRPDNHRCREIGWLLRNTAARISHDGLRVLAHQRALRLQRLQEAGSALARSLDEGEIVRELSRQVIRATGADGAVFCIPELENDRLVTAYRLVRGVEHPRAPIPLGNGVIAQVARSGRSFRMGDRESDREHQHALENNLMPSIDDIVGDIDTAASVLAVPLLVGIRLVGVIAVFATLRNVFSPEDEEVLSTMASQAATAIANARRYAESERERRQIEALADVARAVGSSLRLGEVQRLIMRHALSLLRADGACIALREGEYMHIVAGMGEADVLAGVHLPVSHSLLGVAVTKGENVISNGFEKDERASRAVRRLTHIHRSLITPLVTARGTIGALSVINRDEPFTEDDARVLRRLADQVSVAIVNARLFEEIEHATREWKVAFDAIASGMVVLDDVGLITRCNAAACQLTGVGSIPELLGQQFSVALVGEGDDSAQVESLILQARTEGVPVRATIRHADLGRLLDVIAAPHPDGGSVVTFSDVTEIHGLAERHRLVVETASEAIIITDTQHRVAFANPAAEALFGRGSLIGIPTSDLIPTEARSTLYDAESAGLSGSGQRYELPVIGADGSVRFVSISSAPLIEVGQITGTVACLRDITEQRADALALARSESRYARLVESATDAIFTIDVEGRFTSVNESLVEEAGRTREELTGQSCLLLVDPRDRAIAQATLQAVLAGERQKSRLRLIGAGGKTRAADLFAAPIMEDDKVVGGLGIVRDITDDTLSREAKAQQERLMQLDKVLRTIANELNNPLASLMTVAELQTMSPSLVDEDRQAAEQIRDEARRVSRLVRHLFGASREGIDDRMSVRLNQVVLETLDLHAYLLRQGHVFVRTELAALDPAVEASPAQLQQVLLNLLTNAVEALREWDGRREIVVRTTVVGDKACIIVEDSGPGIPHGMHLRIFEPLYTTRTDNQMRGLGLPVASAIVGEHGGTIEAKSTDNSGASFVITLPAVAATAIEASNVALSGQRVLVCEDESTLRSAIQKYLARQGMSVTAVDNGFDALAAIEGAEFDVVLLDLRMYGMSGDEVYEQLLEVSPQHAERVIFVTGDLQNDAAAEFVAATGRPALAKPFQLTELMQLLGTLVKAA